MIIGFLAYLVIFILILQIIAIFSYMKKRAYKIFSRLNYINDSTYVDDEDIENEV